MDNEKMMSFPPESAGKVERLLDVLEEMTAHPSLKGQFAMYGGTAINLFMLDIPRLSVDIDVTYIGSSDKDAMLAARPVLERAIDDVARALGYSIDAGRVEHAGRTFFLGYRSSHGPDNVKIDFTYLNRVPLFPVQERSTPLRDGIKVPILSDYELVGGKAKAFFSRVKVRDLYDLSNLTALLDDKNAPDQRELFHKTILFDAALSAAFPFGFEGRELRFANMDKELKTELYPMLHVEGERPILEALMNSAVKFIDEWVEPQNDNEREFVERFAKGDYDPSLIFDEDEISSRAEESPEAAWKLHNIKKMDR